MAAGMQVFTASGTFTPVSGRTYKIIAVGGGGGNTGVGSGGTSSFGSIVSANGGNTGAQIITAQNQPFSVPEHYFGLKGVLGAGNNGSGLHAGACVAYPHYFSGYPGSINTRIWTAPNTTAIAVTIGTTGLQNGVVIVTWDA